MAATFKIHEDDDTVSFNKIKPNKEKKVNRNRCVLGQIQNKFIKESFSHVALKKDIAVRDPVLSTGFTEKIKTLDLKNHVHCTKENNRNNVARSPLKDLKNCLIAPEAKPCEKVLSPMSIDSSPLVKHNIKEIEKLLDNQTPIGGSKINVAKTTVDVVSPMSVDTSPFISRTYHSRSSLDDLYGCQAYMKDIFKYLRKIEEKDRPKAYYMRRQPDINYSMRSILVDWLVEVSEEYKLKNDTLFMAVSYIDRFLSSMAVVKPKLQLLGTSAMFIASKFEEIYPPEVGEFTYITNDSYTVKQVLRMERLILRVIAFDLSYPTSYTFLVHISSCLKLPSKIIHLAMYICELTLLEADPYLEIYPSLIASGAIALARRCLDYADIWPSNLAQATSYTLYQLGPAITHLNETHRRSFTSLQTAIRTKYSTTEYECVSQVPFKRLILRESFSH